MQSRESPSFTFWSARPSSLKRRIELRPSQHHPRLSRSLRSAPFGRTHQDRGIDVRVASPRVFKPGEERILHFLLRLDCAILVRSSGMLQLCVTGGVRNLTGDFSLNAANSLTAESSRAGPRRASRPPTI